MTVSTDTSAKPTVKFDKPFVIKKTADSVVAAGTGDALATGQTITFDYVLVDGRTGKEIQTSYGGTPASLVLDATKTGKQLVTGLTGKKVGSRVLVAIAPKDGLAKRLNSKKVKKDDTLLFVIDVKGVRTPLAKATGDAVAPVDGLPTVALADDGKPTITIPSGVAAPTSLVVQPLIKGTGPVVDSRADDQRPLHRRDLRRRQAVRLVVGPRHARRLRDRQGQVIAGLGRRSRRPDRRLAGAARRAARQGLRHRRVRAAPASRAPTPSCSSSTSSTPTDRTPSIRHLSARGRAGARRSSTVTRRRPVATSCSARSAVSARVTDSLDAPIMPGELVLRQPHHVITAVALREVGEQLSESTRGVERAELGPAAVGFPQSPDDHPEQTRPPPADDASTNSRNSVGRQHLRGHRVERQRGREAAVSRRSRRAPRRSRRGRAR